MHSIDCQGTGVYNCGASKPNQFIISVFLTCIAVHFTFTPVEVILNEGGGFKVYQTSCVVFFITLEQGSRVKRIQF